MKDLTVSDAAAALGVSVAYMRQLLRSGAIASELRGRLRFVSKDALAAYSRERERRLEETRAAASQEWDWEGNVAHAVEEHHRMAGWQIVSRADAGSKEHGIDLRLERDGVSRSIEVKGWPTPIHIQGAKAGQAKRWRPTMARNYMADLILKALILRSSHPRDEIAIAFPARPTFMGLLDRIHDSIQLLGIGVFVVYEGRRVEEVLTPRRPGVESFKGMFGSIPDVGEDEDFAGTRDVRRDTLLA